MTNQLSPTNGRTSIPAYRIHYRAQQDVTREYAFIAAGDLSQLLTRYQELKAQKPDKRFFREFRNLNQVRQ